MDTLELDTAIEELETRVERLRSLYEQYFMGIEKIAPAVAHKDVTRRIDVLRHEQIRNTAKRFRLQMIIQRYNTFQQYWQRILREIENGTYRRHVLRVERSISANRPSVAPNISGNEVGLVEEAAPESEVPSSARARKSVSPSSARHSVPVMQRHSSLPPAEKVEAFTRALERDLAAALDNAEGFERHSSTGDPFSLDLDEMLAGHVSSSHSQTRPARESPTNITGSATKLPLRMPAQSAVGGHGLPPLPTRNTPKGAGVAHPSVPSARVATEDRNTARMSTPSPTKNDAVNTSAEARRVAGLSDERLKELHRELLAAKQKTNDTADVSLGSLTRKLAATSEQLRQKHNGKQIDFAVVIKDGKAVVKPIVR